MKYKLALILICICNNYFSQKQTLKGERIFYSIAETKTVSPDSVFVLHLGNNNLRAFPVEIYKFINLHELSFYDENCGDMFLNTPWLLTEEEKEKPRRIFQKHPDVNTDLGWTFSTPRKNKIKKFPGEIAQLKKLTYILLDPSTPRKEVEKLQKLLPDCTVYVKG